MRNITISNAYVYVSTGSFYDIKSDISISSVERAAFIAQITFNPSYAGTMIWIEFTIA